MQIQTIADISQAATSFECDGCGHHASFHSLENVEEDAILKKWSEQETQPEERGKQKRRRIADKPADAIEVVDITESAAANPTRPRARAKP